VDNSRACKGTRTKRRPREASTSSNAQERLGVSQSALHQPTPKFVVHTPSLLILWSRACPLSVPPSIPLFPLQPGAVATCHACPMRLSPPPRPTNSVVAQQIAQNAYLGSMARMKLPRNTAYIAYSTKGGARRIALAARASKHVSLR